MDMPPVVSPEEWKAARERLLVKEKELTHARDAMAAERRRMPWLAVEKQYIFDGPQGKVSLLDLFEGRPQLQCWAGTAGAVSFFLSGFSGAAAGFSAFSRRTCVAFTEVWPQYGQRPSCEVRMLTYWPRSISALHLWKLT